PLLKEADGSGETGCKPQSSGPAGAGTGRVVLPGPDGAPIQINLTDGMVGYQCRNITMQAFAEWLRRAASVGIAPMLDQTGLTGAWNFDLKYSFLSNSPSGAQVTVADAVEKRLGLKLEEKPLPVQVLTVQSVNQKPIDNPAGTAEALPASSRATEF